MATEQKKTTSAAKSSSKANGAAPRSTGSRASSGGGSRKSSSGNGKRPIRREVTGVLFLLAALCVLVSYFNEDGWLIALLPTLFKGLLGLGFYLVAPAFAVAAWVLLTHRGKPVALRTCCALLVPCLFGSLCHMLFCRLELTGPDGLLTALWTSGGMLHSGGAIAGGIAHGFMAVLGKTASVIIFIVLILIALMVALRITLAMLVKLWAERERRNYSAEDYAEEEGITQTVAAVKAEKAAAKQKQAERARVAAEIDIPLDGEERTAPSGRGGFFKPKAKEQLTPADVLTGTGDVPFDMDEE